MIRKHLPWSHVLLGKSSWLGLKFEHWLGFSCLIKIFLKFFKTFVLQNTSDQLLFKYPVKHYLFKVNNRNTKMMCEVNSKVTKKTSEQRRWVCSGVLIVNFEQNSLVLLQTANPQTWKFKSQIFNQKVNSLIILESTWHFMELATYK